LLDKQLQKDLAKLKKLTPDQLVVNRYEKFRRMGQFFESVTTATAKSL
jgi:acetyl-CoA carboxylase alpha subunit